jgi:hypothetical protein
MTPSALSRSVARQFRETIADVECPECGRWERARALACRWCGLEPGQGRTIGERLAAANAVDAVLSVVVLLGVTCVVTWLCVVLL